MYSQHRWLLGWPSCSKEPSSFECVCVCVCVNKLASTFFLPLTVPTAYLHTLYNISIYCPLLLRCLRQTLQVKMKPNRRPGVRYPQTAANYVCNNIFAQPGRPFILINLVINSAGSCFFGGGGFIFHGKQNLQGFLVSFVLFFLHAAKHFFSNISFTSLNTTVHLSHLIRSDLWP